MPKSPNTVSGPVRRNILEVLRSERVKFFGDYDELEFLRRVYDLEAIPPLDGQHHMGALADYFSYRINTIPPKWDEYWIYGDSRFGLMDGPDDQFLRFLCEMLHPLVRSSSREVNRLCNFFNTQLAQDRWQLVVESKIRGRPVFAAQRKSIPANASAKGVEDAAVTLGAAQIARQISRMEASIESDPELAIGTAKELVETCCKTILAERGKCLAGTSDIPTLTRETLRELRLVPDEIVDSARGSDVIKRLLNNLGTIGNALAELRGLYGTGHGKHGKLAGLGPRHAKLAVGAAATLATFLFETHKETATRGQVVRPP